MSTEENELTKWSLVFEQYLQQQSLLKIKLSQNRKTISQDESRVLVY